MCRTEESGLWNASACATLITTTEASLSKAPKPDRSSGAAQYPADQSVV